MFISVDDNDNNGALVHRPLPLFQCCVQINVLLPTTLKKWECPVDNHYNYMVPIVYYHIAMNIEMYGALLPRARMRSKGLSNRFVRLLLSLSSLTRKRPDLEFWAPR